MPVTLSVQLWSVAGHEDELIAYEDEVLLLLARHDGRLVQRLRAARGGDGPFELHTIEFASESAFDRYMADPTRSAMADRRDRAIARTEVLRVDVVIAS